MSTLYSAKVKDGVIVVEGVELTEGQTVTVVVDGPVNEDGEYEPTAAELAELDEAIAEADRGEGIPWSQVRAELFARR